MLSPSLLLYQLPLVIAYFSDNSSPQGLKQECFGFHSHSVFIPCCKGLQLIADKCGWRSNHVNIARIHVRGKKGDLECGVLVGQCAGPSVAFTTSTQQLTWAIQLQISQDIQTSTCPAKEEQEILDNTSLTVWPIGPPNRNACCLLMMWNSQASI
jgi:hypothetical protein